MVEFCPKCGTMLRPQRESNGRNVLLCPKCGYRKEVGKSGKYVLSQDIRHSERERTLVIEGGGDVRILPKIKGEVTCPKCGNDEAYYWMMQTRRADEPPTRFYRCTRCNHVWREYE